MDSPDMQRVSLYLPRKLVQEADRTKEKCGFSSRNEFYAKAVESFIAEQLLEDDVINSALTDKLARAVHALSEDNARAISKGLVNCQSNTVLRALKKRFSVGFTLAKIHG